MTHLTELNMQKPFTGTLLGVLIGFATAIFLARQGIWPADQLTVFFLPGILGLLGLLLLSMGRPSKGPGTLVLSLLIAVPMTLWGALGFGTVNETGQLNGGCDVFAASDIDETDVVDTSRSSPFAIDPDGGLFWEAASPEVFQNYDWSLEVYVGGLPITIESGTEANDAGDLENGGDVSDIRAYAESRGIDIDLYRGIYKVGGSAASCDGFGFVEITGDGIDPIALIALIVAITLLIILLVLTFWKRGATSASDTGPSEADTPDGGENPGDGDSEEGPGLAASIAAGAIAADYDSPEDIHKLDGDDVEEIQEALGETDGGDQD